MCWGDWRGRGISGGMLLGEAAVYKVLVNGRMDGGWRHLLDNSVRRNGGAMAIGRRMGGSGQRNKQRRSGSRNAVQWDGSWT